MTKRNDVIFMVKLNLIPHYIRDSVEYSVSRGLHCEVIEHKKTHIKAFSNYYDIFHHIALACSKVIYNAK